jgi:hypothetical protein
VRILVPHTKDSACRSEPEYLNNFPEDGFYAGSGLMISLSNQAADFLWRLDHHLSDASEHLDPRTFKILSQLSVDLNGLEERWQVRRWTSVEADMEDFLHALAVNALRLFTPSSY